MPIKFNDPELQAKVDAHLKKQKEDLDNTVDFVKDARQKAWISKHNLRKEDKDEI